MCFKSNMLFIRLGYYLWLYRLLLKMNGADSEPRRQLPTIAAGKMTVAQPKSRQFCVEDGGLLEIVFFCDQS